MSGNPNNTNTFHQSALYNHQNGLHEGIKFNENSGQKITPSQNFGVTSSEKITPIGLEPRPNGASKINNANSRAPISL